MDKRLILLFFIAGITLHSFAQGNANQSINEIKKQGDIYLYAESTSQTWEEALANANYLLGSEVEMWAKTLDTKPTNTNLAEMQDHIQCIKSMRGECYRAFVYVKKADFVPIANVTKSVDIPISKEQEATIQEVVPTMRTENPVYQPTPFEQQILAITDANDIGIFIKQQKDKGKISAYGKYKDMPSNIDCYLFVYNREMAITAYLRKQGTIFINLKTGKQDQVTNYKGCGAWWFQLKY